MFAASLGPPQSLPAAVGDLGVAPSYAGSMALGGQRLWDFAVGRALAISQQKEFAQVGP